MFASKPAWVLFFVVACLGLAAFTAPPASAQQDTQEPALINIAEAGAGYGWFSDPFGTGEGVFARYSVMRPGVFTMRFEANYGSRFDQIGRTIGFSYARVLSNRLTLTGSFFTGTGLLAPDYWVEFAATRSFLTKRNLLLTLRLRVDQSKLEYGTKGVSVGMVYYFPKYWIVESNALYDRGTPGDTNSYSFGAALTWARYKKLYVVGGFNYGDANYTIVSEDLVFSNLTGRSYNIGVTRWVAPTWGFSVRAEYGTNNVYSGSGLQFSVFKEW